MLKIVSNNTFFMSSLLQKKSFNSFISVLPQLERNENKKTFDMKSVVVAKFPDIDDDLRQFLKDKKVNYIDQLLSVKSMLGDDNDSDAQDGDSYDGQKDEENKISFKIETRKKIVTTTDKDTSKKSLEYIYYVREYQP